MCVFSVQESTSDPLHFHCFPVPDSVLFCTNCSHMLCVSLQIAATCSMLVSSMVCGSVLVKPMYVSFLACMEMCMQYMWGRSYCVLTS